MCCLVSVIVDSTFQSLPVFFFMFVFLFNVGLCLRAFLCVGRIGKTPANLFSKNIRFWICLRSPPKKKYKQNQGFVGIQLPSKKEFVLLKSTKVTREVPWDSYSGGFGPFVSPLKVVKPFSPSPKWKRPNKGPMLAKHWMPDVEDQDLLYHQKALPSKAEHGQLRFQQPIRVLPAMLPRHIFILLKDLFLDLPTKGGWSVCPNWPAQTSRFNRGFLDILCFSSLLGFPKRRLMGRQSDLVGGVLFTDFFECFLKTLCVPFWGLNCFTNASCCGLRAATLVDLQKSAKFVRKTCSGCWNLP